MSEMFKGESLDAAQSIERDFGIEVARAIDRLRDMAVDKNFDALMGILKRIIASDGIDISEDQFEELKKMLSNNKRELGLDSESK
jgi:hypothetical protein